MWLLGRLMPIVLGSRLPNDDNHWCNFLLLLEKADLLLAPVLTEDHAALVSTLITSHHKEFTVVDPDASITPKMHYMVHTPRILLE